MSKDIVESEFEAGGITKHLENWKNITSDPFILNMVKGAQIPLENHNFYCNNSRKNNISDNEYPIIDKEIQRLLKLKVIERSEHEEGEIISPIFAVPKSDGTSRIILNLKKFNESVEYEHFKMENVMTAIHMIRRGCFMASVDLRPAYYSVSVEKEDRKYLKFCWNGQLFQYTCFPNGLSNCPRYFTKLMKPVYACLRSKGHLSTAYIDDPFLQAQSFEECLQNVKDTVFLLQSLGFVVHAEKSELYPCHELKYLGFIFNSVDMTIRLTNEKAQKIKKAGVKIRNKAECSIREVAQFIGLCVASFPAVRWGPLHYRQLEKLKSVSLKENRGNFEVLIQLNDQAIKEIDWWINNKMSSYAPLEATYPEVEIRTDASTSGG